MSILENLTRGPTDHFEAVDTYLPFSQNTPFVCCKQCYKKQPLNLTPIQTPVWHTDPWPDLTQNRWPSDPEPWDPSPTLPCGPPRDSENTSVPFPGRISTGDRLYVPSISSRMEKISVQRPRCCGRRAWSTLSDWDKFYERYTYVSWASMVV